MSVLPVNGLLTRIDHVTGVDVTGAVTFAVGEEIAVGCVFDSPTSRQVYTLGAAIRDVSVVLMVEKEELVSGETINEGDRVEANQGSESSALYVVVKRQLFEMALGGEHYELFCKGAM